MKVPSKEEIEKQSEEMGKIYECYRYLHNHVGSDQTLCKRIEDLGRQHLLSKMKEMQYSVQIPLENRKRELEEMLKKMKDDKEKSGAQ